ncbi:MAG: DRTGG domain-containing protein [Desulfobacterales bacterium]|jgi:predicted transcriptional regulator
MRVKDLVDEFDLQVTAGESGLDREVTEGYCGDLLSEVMGNAPTGCAWMTVQGHQNIVAVAVMREIAAIIITGGQTPDDAAIKKANQEGIPLLLWPYSSFRLAGRIFGLGVGNLATE